jgi:hypothetical protein
VVCDVEVGVPITLQAALGEAQSNAVIVRGAPATVTRIDLVVQSKH